MIFSSGAEPGSEGAVIKLPSEALITYYSFGSGTRHFDTEIALCWVIWTKNG
jgi:hypothetical protein